MRACLFFCEMKLWNSIRSILVNNINLSLILRVPSLKGSGRPGGTSGEARRGLEGPLRATEVSEALEALMPFASCGGLLLGPLRDERLEGLPPFGMSRCPPPWPRPPSSPN